MTDPRIAEALHDTLISPNESDSNLEAANVVDGLFFIGRALIRLAKAVEALRPEEDRKTTPAVPSAEDLEALRRAREEDDSLPGGA
jgi:hypothetical protein